MKYIQAGEWSLGNYVYFYSWAQSTNYINQYSIGTITGIMNGWNTNSLGNCQLPLGSFCSGGPFKINSQIDSSNNNCMLMNLAMDSTGLLFQANAPYPNQKCTVNFKCISNSEISSDIIAVSYDFSNKQPHYHFLI